MQSSVVPANIVYDRVPQFPSRYWRSLQKVIGTTLNFSTGFDPRVQWAVRKDFDSDFGGYKSFYFGFQKKLK